MALLLELRLERLLSDLLELDGFPSFEWRLLLDLLLDSVLDPAFEILSLGSTEPKSSSYTDLPPTGKGGSASSGTLLSFTEGALFRFEL